MIVVVWIVAGLVSLIYLASGFQKLLTPYTKLNEQLIWTKSVSPWVVKLISVLEILGAIGMILPAALNILPWLTPLAALALAVLQVAAVVVHVRIHETKVLPINFVLIILPLFVFVVAVAGLAPGYPAR